MASIINTNINTLTAQRSLAMSQSSLSTSMARLSSGLRINSAKDDAAGMAISERFTAQIRGLDQASRNANDGISLAQTAEGSLAQMADNMQRIRELAVQSANSTNSASDRAALDLEVQQRLAEIDRVAAQTSFNGQKILDGSFGNATFQVGADVGQTIGIDLSTSMRTTNLGRRADYISQTGAYDGTKALGSQGVGVVDTAWASGDLKIAVGNRAAVTIGASVAGPATAAAGQTAGSAYAKAAAINAAGVAGLTAEAHTQVTTAWTDTTGAYAITINGVQVVNAAGAGLTATDFVTAVNQNSGATGVTATYSNGEMTLAAADGRNIIVTGQTTGAGGLGLSSAAPANNTTNDAIDTTTAAWSALGTVRLASNERITLDETNSGALNLGFAADSTLALGNTALNSASVTTVANANSTINAIDAAIASVSSLRSTFGAIQNRFDSVISNLSTTSENLTASRSRVQDADFAKETANLSRSQILQQAGTAMVAQANQLPQGVLALLR